jgi:hypothetical protein
MRETRGTERARKWGHEVCEHCESPSIALKFERNSEMVCMSQFEAFTKFRSNWGHFSMLTIATHKLRCTSQRSHIIWQLRSRDMFINNWNTKNVYREKSKEMTRILRNLSFGWSRYWSPARAPISWSSLKNSADCQQYIITWYLSLVFLVLFGSLPFLSWDLWEFPARFSMSQIWQYNLDSLPWTDGSPHDSFHFISFHFTSFHFISFSLDFLWKEGRKIGSSHQESGASGGQPLPDSLRNSQGFLSITFYSPLSRRNFQNSGSPNDEQMQFISK